MYYYIGDLIPDPKRYFTIDANRYELIRQHKENLICALETEERFDILLGNYRELEEDILTMALRHSVIPAQQSEDWHTQRREINRRIANFLSSARLYLDQLKHNTKKMFGKEAKQTKALKTEISAHYDSSFSYRLMEALRNHVQHKGLAATSFSAKHQLTEIQPGSQSACTVTPLMKKRLILADAELKSDLRREIEALPDTTDLKPHIREYMARLNLINNHVRSLIDAESPVWEKTMHKALEDFSKRSASPEDRQIKAVTVFKCDSEVPSTTIERQEISMEFVEDRKHLKMTNRVTKNLAKIFATGQQRDSMKSK